MVEEANKAFKTMIMRTRQNSNIFAMSTSPFLFALAFIELSN